MCFDEIFFAMKEIAESGEQFYINAVSEYETADAEAQRGMRAWLEDEFAYHDSSIMNIKTTLLLMMYPA